MDNSQKVFLDEAQWLEFHPVFPTPVTGDEKLAALVGYMVGDGTIAARCATYTKKSGAVSVYAPRMTGAFYSNDMGDLVEIQAALHSLGMATNASVTKKKASAEHLEDGWQIQVGNADCETLVASGVPCGKKTEQTFSVPGWIMDGDDSTKRAFLAALFGAEATTLAKTKGGVRTMRPIVMTMHKVHPTPAGEFFIQLQQLLQGLGVQASVTEQAQERYGKTFIGTSVRISGLDNTIAFLENIGFMFCRKKALEGWKWLKYLKAYRFAAEKRRATAIRMQAEGCSFEAIGRAIGGLSRGAAHRLLRDIAAGKGNTAGHGFPEFADWMKERWIDDLGLLRLKTTSIVRRDEPQEVWNMLVGSHDHSYLLASGANNFNSFETMSGRVYHAFDRKVHAKRELAFDPTLPIWIGQDFNIDPMSSVVFQKQRNGELWAIDEIVLPSSNTYELCDELERRYWRYLDQITIYPDPAGAYRGHQRGESDLDIFRERGFKRQKYRRKHPPVADRVNAVNRLLMSANGSVKLYVDPRCKHFINALEQTLYVPGSREVDKKAGVEHAADAGGYCIEFEFPTRKIEILGVSL